MPLSMSDLVRLTEKEIKNVVMNGICLFKIHIERKVTHRAYKIQGLRTKERTNQSREVALRLNIQVEEMQVN